MRPSPVVLQAVTASAANRLKGSTAAETISFVARCPFARRRQSAKSWLVQAPRVEPKASAAAREARVSVARHAARRRAPSRRVVSSEPTPGRSDRRPDEQGEGVRKGALSSRGAHARRSDLTHCGRDDTVRRLPRKILTVLGDSALLAPCNGTDQDRRSEQRVGSSSQCGG
jgi:hypothetical protein